MQGSLWRKLYGSLLPSMVYSSLFSAIFFGTFSFFWELTNKDYVQNHGFKFSLPHTRGKKSEEEQPVHYELLGKSIIVATCAYATAHLVSYPLGVYRNMHMLRSFQKPSPSPLYAQVTSLRAFFSKINRPILYSGVWTRVCWSVISCSFGIVCGSAFLSQSFRNE